MQLTKYGTRSCSNASTNEVEIIRDTSSEIQSRKEIRFFFISLPIGSFLDEGRELDR